MHEILSREEAKKVLEKIGSTSSKLPKILHSDPVIIELKANVGDVIRITRKSPTADITTYYRVVIRG